MAIDRRTFLFNTGLSLAGAAALTASCRAGTAAMADEAAPFDPSRWDSVRQQFGTSPEYVHLASFFLASHPRPVREAIEKHRKALDLNPFETVEHNLFGEPLIVEKKVAEYVGGKAEEIALTDSTTMGLALIYLGLPIKPGQEMLITDHDHYSHHESVRLAAVRNGATVKRIPLFDDHAKISEADIVDRIRKAITPKTRTVGVTWVHSSSGLKLPIRAIAAAVADANKGRADGDRAFLVVDGVHGIGVEDEAVADMGADLFAAGTHKWIFGPRGTGFVWAKSDIWPKMTPIIPSFGNVPYVAWMMESTMQDPAVHKAIKEFTGHEITGTQGEWFSPGGFHAFEHQWAIPAALEFHKQIGKKRVAERIHQLNDQLKEGLATMKHVKLYTPRGHNMSAGIVCFDVEGMKPEAVVAKLLTKKVIASTTPYRVTYARLAPSLLNTPEEVDKTLGYIREMA
jgi:isopenicillin-N epimerase